MTKETGFSEIGSRLHSIRGDADQRGFSRKLNVSQQAISNYERGNLPASWAFIRRMNEDFNINLNWLFTGMGQRDHREGTPYASLTDNRTPGWPRAFLEQEAFADTPPLEFLLSIYFLYLATEPADAKTRLMEDFQAIVEASRLHIELHSPSEKDKILLRLYEALARDDRRAAIAALIDAGGAAESAEKGKAMPRARRAYLAALSLARSQGWLEEAVEAGRRVGRTYRKEARWAEAESCFEKAISSFDQGGGSDTSAGGRVSAPSRARTVLGYGHVAKHQGRFPVARERYLAALAIAMESQDAALRAEVYLDLACLSYHERDWEKAAEFLSSGRAFAEQAGDKKLFKQFKLADALILRERGELEAAEAILRVLLAQARDDMDGGTAALATGNLAEVLIDRGTLGKAEQLLRTTQDAAEDHGDPRDLALRKLLLARIDAARGENGSARTALIDALRYAKEHGLAREFDRAAEAFEAIDGKERPPLTSRTG